MIGRGERKKQQRISWCAENMATYMWDRITLKKRFLEDRGEPLSLQGRHGSTCSPDEEKGRRHVAGKRKNCLMDGEKESPAKFSREDLYTHYASNNTH